MWLSWIGVLLITSGGMCNLGGDHHHGDHHQRDSDQHPGDNHHESDTNHHHHGDHHQHQEDHHPHHEDHHLHPGDHHQHPGDLHQHSEDHSHGHDHNHNDPHKCTKRSLGCSSHKDDFIDDLGELFSLFGLKVLGKDQESADDRPPTEDHAHLSLNTQAIIDELFSPSSTLRPATISPKLQTVTDSLPIKAHDIGRFSSPSDLIMSNHIAEPVFERKPRNFGSTTQAPVYLTETHYYLDQDNHFSPLAHSRQGKQFDGHFQFSDHLDKPVMPVTDMRPFNFALINDVSVDEILKKKKRKPKVVSDLFDSDPFTNDVFKNIPTQELIERNKHIQTGSFFRTNNKEESQSSTNSPVSDKLNDSLSEALVSGITVNPPSHSSTHLKQQVRSKERPSLHWEPPFRNPMVRGNDHQNSAIQQTSQKSVPEQGRNTQITHNIQRQQISLNNKSEKTRIGQRRKDNKQNSHRRRNPHIKSLSKNKSKQKKNLSNQQKLKKTVLQPKVAVAKLPLQKLNTRKNISKDNRQSKALIQPAVDFNVKFASKVQPSGQTKRSQLEKHALLKPIQHTKKQNKNASIEAPEGHRVNNLPLSQPRRGKEKPIIQTAGDSTINILHSTLGQLRKDVQNMAKGNTKHTAPGGSLMNAETKRNSKHKDKKTSTKATKANTGRLSLNKRLNVEKKSKSQRRHKAFTGDSKINHSTKLSSTFECPERKHGVYADISTSCQRFFMCHGDGRKGIFTCPLGTMFNQKHQVCDWPKQVDCENSHIYFDI